MRTREDSSTIYDARYGVNCDTLVTARIHRWAHWGGCAAVLRLDSPPFLAIPKFRCTEERAYIVRVAKIAAQYEYDSARYFRTESFNFVAFDNCFDPLHVNNHFGRWV